MSRAWKEANRHDRVLVETTQLGRSSLRYCRHKANPFRRQSLRRRREQLGFCQSSSSTERNLSDIEPNERNRLGELNIKDDGAFRIVAATSSKLYLYDFLCGGLYKVYSIHRS